MPTEEFRGAIGRALAHYKNELKHGHRVLSPDETDPKSPMERRVLEWLQQTHFYQKLGNRLKVDAQFELGKYLRQLNPTYRHPAYRVDFLLTVQRETKPISIIIEYDGFKEHFSQLDRVHAGNYEEYLRVEDVERQKVLEGYGYRFLRINRFNLGRDPIRTLDERLLKLSFDVIGQEKPHQIIH